MALTGSDVVFARSLVVNEDTTNGGASGAILSTGDNLFPNVSSAQRRDGLVTLRKLFVKFSKDDPAPPTLFHGYIDAPTPGDDAVFIVTAGTPATAPFNTRADVTLNSGDNVCGVSEITQAASAGATTLRVRTETTNYTYHWQNQTVRITTESGFGSSGSSYTDTVTSVTAVDAASGIYDLTLQNGLAFDVAAGNFVQGIADVSVTPGVTAGTSSVAGDGALDTSQITISAVSRSQHVRITFTSADEFDVTSIEYGSIGTGFITSDFFATNSELSGDDFVIPASAWSGTFQAGDSFEFTVIGVEPSWWVVREVPAGAQPISNDYFNFVVEFET